MTPFTIAKNFMLPYIGVLSFDPAVNQATAGKRQAEAFDIEFCAACMTGGGEELFNDGPSAISETQYGDQLYPPTSVTLNVTQFSKTISGLTPSQAWMIGCTINITGDGTFNELMSATTLLRPYAGSSGSVSGTVYGDSIPLPSNIKEVMDPVKLPTLAPLMGTTSREEYLAYGNPHRYGNRRTTGSRIFYTLTNKSVGQPAIWFAENAIDISVAQTVKYLRFNPMPNQAYSASMRVKLKAPVFTAADIYAGTDYNVDPNKAIPMDNHASIFLPMCMQRFMAHPSFNNKMAAQEIARQYAEARRMLADCTPSVTHQNALYH